MTSPRLSGKTALVTGSSAGIGRAIAAALAREGCHVLMHGLEPQPEAGGDEEEQRWLADAPYHQADLADVGATEAMVRGLLERRGSIDVLVNNAVTRHFAAIESFPLQAWDRAMAVNVSAAFHTVRMTLPAMRRQGWGRIINMASVYAMRGTRDRIDYVTSKAAILGMTRAVAAEVLGQGITCNAVCPGSVLTPSIEARLTRLMRDDGLDREAATREFLRGKQPGSRFIPAAHVAELVVFLCGEAAADMNGAVLPMEGGWLAT
jgi:3-hydroxybutyrate dehydrogenase